MMRKKLKKQVSLILRNELGESLDYDRFELSYVKDSQFGDFSTNFAMIYSRDLKKSPREIANDLLPSLNNIEGVEKVAIAGPGFINFTMDSDAWGEELASINDNYAASNIGSGQKLQIEFISANPTGPLTIGNARGGFIGDVLSNVMSRSGFDVTREYYFNDAGTQISKLLESVRMEAGIIPETAERQYRGEYIKDLAHKFNDILKSANDTDAKTAITGEIIKSYIKPAILAMGINYDVWFNEKDLIHDGSFEDTVKRLNKLGLIFDRDGAVWLKTGDLGDERGERVLIKSNGDPTYMAPDIAYHVNIFERRGFDYAIKVLGPDHVAQFPSVAAAVTALFPNKIFRMAGYQWLRVMQGEKEVKVSKRLGQFITAEQLIKEVGLPVARFLVLMRSAESHMDFDLDLAREQSSKNPYYYVMYSYARAHSLLAKAKSKGLVVADHPGLLDNREIAIVKLMSQLPEMMEEIVHDYGVHRLTFYGLEIARLFQDYYETTRIIDMQPDNASKKLFFINQYIIFMDIYWSLLGIIPQTRME